MNAPVMNASAFRGRKVIDVDTHLTEPHDLWTRHAPASLKDRVPQVKTIDGVLSWVIDGDKIINYGANTASSIRRDGTTYAGLEILKAKIDDVHPASHSVKERVAFMDECGISAQILYSNILGFGGQQAVKVDGELRRASIEIYNDAMAEIQADSGKRIFPMAMMPWWDVDLCVKEIERSAKMGLKGININSDPHFFAGPDGNKLPDLGQEHWYPMWEACEAYDLPINFHIGASEHAMDFAGSQGWPGLPYEARVGFGGAMLFMHNAQVMGNLILSGLLDRFTKLKFVSVESGVGWIPYILEGIDTQYLSYCINAKKIERLPSDYFRSNFFACFWFERQDLAHQLRRVGIDNVLFETDFPHPVCLYPIDDMEPALEGLTEEEKVKVLSGNAARVYNIEL
jgi:uncharacterized protein